VKRQTNLLQIVFALRTPSRLTRLLHRRQQQGHQNRNNRNHHQQLNQRETHSLTPLAPLSTPTPATLHHNPHAPAHKFTRLGRVSSAAGNMPAENSLTKPQKKTHTNSVVHILQWCRQIRQDQSKRITTFSVVVILNPKNTTGTVA
jgi:hypothetical protein